MPPSRARPTRLSHLVASRAQTLEDVASAQMATVSVISGEADRDRAIEALRESALDRGFAVASASLADAGLHDLHAIVGALAHSLRVPGLDAGRKNGLVAALDAFAAEHGKRTIERFEEAAEREALAGELRPLALEYLRAASGRAETRRLHAWLGGRDVTLASDTLRPLAARTAKRALAQLTRLVRALGHRGTRVLLTDAEALVDLSPGRRDVAYTVLRELIDNADGGQGMIAAELLLIGARSLETRVHTLTDHPALASRICAPSGERGLPVPHQSWVRLDREEGEDERSATSDGADESIPPPPEPRPVEARRAGSLRALIRVVQGLPPIEAAPELTIGMDQIDARIEQLFETASNDGSVFAVLSGEYGSGKTHHLLHLEARALADQRPVLRLAVERLDEDLGNPQRHLRRMIEGAVLPLRRRSSPLDRLDAWLGQSSTRRRLHASLRQIAESEGEAARAAERALRDASEDDLSEPMVLETLGALDLVDKPGAPSYRRDAYARLHLWVELLSRLEGCEGPVVILDEAENLYRAGVSRSERRTALRSLGFYCGGSLPRACVVLAVTPETLEALREEAGELLDEIESPQNVLPSEDVAMLRRRLLRARPIPVTKLGKDDLAALAEQARKLARDVRGRHKDLDWDPFVAKALRESSTPRELLRKVTARAERLAWESE